MTMRCRQQLPRAIRVLLAGQAGKAHRHRKARAHRHARIERAERVLEDELEMPPAGP
jgi:hypothetical protein